MNYNFDTKQDQVLIFADILGFSNLIKTNDGIGINIDGKQKDDIILEFSSFADYLNEKINYCFSSLKYLWMSDSFAISSDLNNIDDVIECFFNIQHDMFCSGLVLRGAICVGNLYHEGNIWGEALVRAVEIEKKDCIYPRILINDKDFEKLKISEKYNKYISKTNDKEEYWLIDPFEYEIEKILNGKDSNIVIWLSLNQIISMIEQGMSNSDNKICEKWIWLADRMVVSLDKHKYEIDKMLIKEKSINAVSVNNCLERLRCNNIMRNNEKTQIQIFEYMAEIDKMSYETELKRENSLISQASQMQTAFSFLAVVVLMIAPLLIEYSHKVSSLFIFIATSSIIAVLLLSLICAVVAQRRKKNITFSDVSKMNAYIYQNANYFETEEQRFKYITEMYEKLQESKQETNENRTSLIRSSMFLFYVALGLCFMWFILGICKVI